MDERLLSYIDSKRDDFIRDLKRLCSQPSISTQDLGIQECASLVEEMMKESGLSSEIFSVDKGCPIVYGEAYSEDAAKTIIFYNHYDVQPPEPLDEWTTPPFKPEIRDGRLYARGASDNKGNIVARLKAVKTLLDIYGRLPVNVKFIVEGEEEIGSPSLSSFIKRFKTRLRADGCIWEAGYKDLKERPIIILGAKGILYVEFLVKGALKDLHSSNATLIENPAWKLIWALNSLKDRSNKVLIEGFYDKVKTPSDEDIEYLKEMPFEEDEFKRRLGLKEFVNELSGLDVKIAHFFEPTCNICGFTSGYEGVGTKTVLPSRALAKVDFRLVPDQKPHEIFEELKKHLTRSGFRDIGLSMLSGYEPTRTDFSSYLAKIVGEAALDVYKTGPVYYPMMPGSGPMYLFTKMLGIPTVSVGIGYSDSNIHAPDENIRLADFIEGVKHIISILMRF